MTTNVVCQALKNFKSRELAMSKNQMTAVILVQGIINAVTSMWEEIRKDLSQVRSSLKQSSAVSMLALWADMQRFPKAAVDTGLWTKLDGLVQVDKQELLRQFMSYMEYEPLRQFHLSVAALKKVVEKSPKSEEVRDTSLALLHVLDDISLACAAAEELGGVPDNLLKKFKQSVTRAEDCFAVNIGTFQNLGEYASMFMGEFAPDLDFTHPVIWETVLKFRRIEEKSEEACCAS